MADQLAEIHEAGVKRHPRSWVAANQAAVNAANWMDFDYSREEHKSLLSLVVLQVLDKVNAP